MREKNRGGRGRFVAAAGIVAWACLGSSATLAAVSISSGETYYVRSAEDVMALKKAGDVTIEAGGTLEFNVYSTSLHSPAPKISGAGTIVFNYNGTGSDYFRAEWDGTDFSGTLIVKGNSALDIYGTKCFGTAKVEVYASDVHQRGAIVFIGAGSGTYANDFALYGRGTSARACLRAENADVILTGKVTADGSAAPVRVTACSNSGRTMGRLHFKGPFSRVAGDVYTYFVGPNGEGLPEIVFGDGTGAAALDLGGSEEEHFLTSDNAIGTNVLATAVTNGIISIRNGSVWRLGMDHPLRHNGTAEARFSWPNSTVSGGWVDLNGYDLRIGAWGDLEKWNANAGKYIHGATETRVGGFCNHVAEASTLQFRTLFGAMSDTRLFRLAVDGNVNIEYDGVYAAYPTKTGSDGDFSGSFSCWLGNFSGQMSPMTGRIQATMGALHMGSSAVYPNVSNFVAKTKGAVYIHAGASLNPDAVLSVEGNGRMYLQQDITVSHIEVDGVVVTKRAGRYTTDDFASFFSFTGSAGGNPVVADAPCRTITVTCEMIKTFPMTILVR